MKFKILRLTTILISLFIIISGMLILFIPSFPQFIYELEPTAQNKAFIRLTGIRQLFLGLFMGILLYTNQYKVLGTFLLLMLIIPLTDFLVAVGRVESIWKAFIHISFVPIVLYIGMVYRKAKP